jgi:hypothetical protein
VSKVLENRLASREYIEARAKLFGKITHCVYP